MPVESINRRCRWARGGRRPSLCQGAVGCAVAALLIVLALLSGCSRPPPEPAPKLIAAETPIRDLVLIPQDATVFVTSEGHDRPLVTEEVTASWAENYRRRHFAPWHRSVPAHGLDDATQGIGRLESEGVYGETLQRRDLEWFAAMRSLMNLDSFPNTQKRAITIVHTSLRLVPTAAPAFFSSRIPGEGFPFDHLQESSVWAGTPLFVSHTSRDGAWVLAEAPLAMGWIPVDDVAFVDEAFAAAYETPRLVAVLHEDVSVKDTTGVFRFSAGMGMALPLAPPEEGEGGGLFYRVIVPAADANRKAVPRRAKISGDDAVLMPWPFTPEHAAALINRLMGRPYGWGGLFGNRDCSSALRDLFAPFGLWLPRSSGAQVRAGKLLALADFDPAQKEKVVLERGVPFGTLLWAPGHIAFYVGAWEGRPVAFHVAWGIKTQETDGREGRRIIGKGVLTTLEPGREIADVAAWGKNLLQRLEAMAVLVPGNEE